MNKVRLKIEQHHPLFFGEDIPDRSSIVKLNVNILRNSCEHMKEEDSLILKVPQIIIARRLRRGGGFIENEAHFKTGIFTDQFYRPAVEILEFTLVGFIFEQEYHPKIGMKIISCAFGYIRKRKI